MSKTKKKQIAAIAFVWIAIVVGFWISKDSFSSSHTVATKTQETPVVRQYSDAEVYATAEAIVSKYLKAPATAKFPSMSEVKITRFSDGFRVDGYVDSQNSFGAMLRSPFTTVFSFKDQTDVADIYVVVLDGETLLKRTPTNQ